MNATRKRDRLKMDFMNYAELREFMCPGYDAMREALEELVRLLPQPANRQYAESRVLYDVVANAKAALALAKG